MYLCIFTKEINFWLRREHEGLLHKLEMLPGTENTRKPKADPSRMVKSFSRSAAGTKMSVAKNLRPPDVLRRTISYLLHEYALFA